MVINNNIFIKSNLLNSDKFVVENNDILTIDKKINICDPTESSSFFECIISLSDESEIFIYAVNQIVYNPYTKELTLLNIKNINDSVVYKCKIEDSKIVSIRVFDRNKILIIFDENDK